MKKLSADNVIEFAYDSVTKLEIGPEGVIVRDEVAKVAQDRLGGNINVEDVDAPDTDEIPGGDEGEDGPSHKELQARAEELGLKKNGTKAELAERIAAEEARLEAEKTDGNSSDENIDSGDVIDETV